MSRLRHIAAALAVVLGMLLLVCGPAAAATPEQVIADQADNGIIDGAYTPAELRAALDLIQQSSGVTGQNAAAAIQNALFAQVYDVTGDTSATGTSATAQERPGPDRSVLAFPSAPSAVAGGDVPLPFIVLSILAFALIVTGATSSAIRRFTRTS